MRCPDLSSISLLFLGNRTFFIQLWSEGQDSVVKRQVVEGLGAFRSRECALSSRLRSFGKEGQPRVEMLTLIHVPTELRSQSFCSGGPERQAAQKVPRVLRKGAKGEFWKLRRKTRAT